MTIRKQQKGVTMIEYAMIAALIAIAALVAIQMVGNGINTTFTNVKNAVNGS